MEPPAAMMDRLMTIEPGEALPDATVEESDGGAARLRKPGKVVALLIRHPRCAACDAYAQALRSVRSDIESWGGRLVMTHGREARLLIADQHALVHELTQVGEDHTFPEPDAVEESVKFLATQCPECGGPEGAWTDLATKSGY